MEIFFLPGKKKLIHFKGYFYGKGRPLRTGGYAYGCATLQNSSCKDDTPCRGELHVRENAIIRVPGPHSHPSDDELADKLRLESKQNTGKLMSYVRSVLSTCLLDWMSCVELT